MVERKSDRQWGGRFERAPNERFDAFQRSFGFDRRLLPYEIAVDRAWAAALHGARILHDSELRDILAALDKIAERVKSEPNWVDNSTAEDVHHFVEKALVESLGPVGWKLHTGRSRNDLVATEFRLFVLDAISATRRGLQALVRAFLAQARTNLKMPMAGMTHMQHAQPILLSHFLMAHAEAFTRDLDRLQSAAVSADCCPMGSGALAGCAFPIDRVALARTLGFSRITANSLDAVSDRDFVLDYLFALAGIATHLSRLAEDFVIFASQEFSWVLLPDEYSTGSSLMPQKKNPDSWELLRGKTGRIIASLFSLFTTLKGLPTSYQRDLQEDKENLFATHDQMQEMLAVATGSLAATKFREDRLRAAASNAALFATDAADYLVRRGVPFRQAHDLVGQVLREAEKQGKPWNQLNLGDVRKISSHFDEDLLKGASPESSIASKGVPGGTAEDSIRAAMAQLEVRLTELEKKP